MTRKTNKEAILFDLDGTLWDSGEGVVGAWNEVLRNQPDTEKQITLEDIHGYMGLPMDEIKRRLFAGEDLSEARANEIMDACMDHENEYLLEHGGILYPHLTETLECLKQDYFLAVVSNCQVGYIESFLDHHGLREYFDDFESFGATNLQKWDNIKLVMERNGISRALYVGDIERDYLAATKAGIPFIHAAYGFGEISDPVVRIEEFKELPEAVRTVFSA